MVKQQHDHRKARDVAFESWLTGISWLIGRGGLQDAGPDWLGVDTTADSRLTRGGTGGGVVEGLGCCVILVGGTPGLAKPISGCAKPPTNAVGVGRGGGGGGGGGGRRGRGRAGAGATCWTIDMFLRGLLFLRFRQQHVHETAIRPRTSTVMTFQKSRFSALTLEVL